MPVSITSKVVVVGPDLLSPTQLVPIQELRQKVYKKIPKLPIALVDGHDCHSWQWRALSLAGLAGVSRLCIHDAIGDIPDFHLYAGFNLSEFKPPFASLNRLAVLPDFEGQGLATKMFYQRLRLAQLMGCGTVLICNRYPSFHEKLKDLGFKELGEIKESDWENNKAFALRLEPSKFPKHSLWLMTMIIKKASLKKDWPSVFWLNSDLRALPVHRNTKS